MKDKPRVESQLDSYVLFEVAGAWYGLRSSDIKHIEMLEQVTGVPNAPDFVEGVVFSRGVVIPVLDLRTCFGFPKAPRTLRNRLLVVESAGRTVGLVVDSARDFARLSEEDILSAPGELSEASGRQIQGVARLDDRLILILSMSEVLEIAGTEEAGRLRAVLDLVQAEVARIETESPEGRGEIPAGKQDSKDS